MECAAEGARSGTLGGTQDGMVVAVVNTRADLNNSGAGGSRPTVDGMLLYRVGDILARARDPTTSRDEALEAIRLAVEEGEKGKVALSMLLPALSDADKKSYAGCSIVTVSCADNAKRAGRWAKGICRAMVKFFDCELKTTKAATTTRFMFYGIASMTVCAAVAAQTSITMVARWSETCSGSFSSHAFGLADELYDQAEQYRRKVERNARAADRRAVRIQQQAIAEASGSLPDGHEDDHTACAEALSTPELLEAILLELPCRSVAPMARVSQFWESTIDSSMRLQVALCRRPIRPSMDRGRAPTPIPQRHTAWVEESVTWLEDERARDEPGSFMGGLVGKGCWFFGGDYREELFEAWTLDCIEGDDLSARAFYEAAMAGATLTTAVLSTLIPGGPFYCECRAERGWELRGDPTAILTRLGSLPAELYMTQPPVAALSMVLTTYACGIDTDAWSKQRPARLGRTGDENVHFDWTAVIHEAQSREPEHERRMLALASREICNSHGVRADDIRKVLQEVLVTLRPPRKAGSAEQAWSCALTLVAPRCSC